MREYLYRHGISDIYAQSPIYSDELTPPSLPDGEYEAIEHEHIGKKDGSRILVKKIEWKGLIVHYLTVKFVYGWIRQTVVFRHGERDPFPPTG